MNTLPLIVLWAGQSAVEVTWCAKLGRMWKSVFDIVSLWKSVIPQWELNKTDVAIYFNFVEQASGKIETVEQYKTNIEGWRKQTQLITSEQHSLNTEANYKTPKHLVNLTRCIFWGEIQILLVTFLRLYL